MKNSYGVNIGLSLFGGSHEKELGGILTGFPKGLKLHEEELSFLLARRAPGRSPFTSKRKESDKPQFTQGLVCGITDGSPIRVVFQNENANSADYEAFADTPRPGHADLAARLKYGENVNLAGGGIFSGRMTAPLTALGGLALQYLGERGIFIGAHIAEIHGKKDIPFDKANVCRADFKKILSNPFPTLSKEAGEEMQNEIQAAASAGDSVGGIAECAVVGLPAGLGEHPFCGIEGRLASLLYAVPAVKGVDFGVGFGVATLFGSENNDAVTVNEKGNFATKTNNCGGILGGMTTGAPLIFRIAVKPTPSIAKVQQTVSLSRKENTEISVTGRHDPCILPRVIPVTEAVAALAVLDILLDKE